MGSGSAHEASRAPTPGVRGRHRAVGPAIHSPASVGRRLVTGLRHPFGSLTFASFGLGLVALFLGVTGAVFSATTVNPSSTLTADQLNAYVPTAVTATRTAVTTCQVSWTPVASPPSGLTYDVTDGSSTVATAQTGTSASITVPSTAVTPTVKVRLNGWTSTSATAASAPCNGYPAAPTVTLTLGDGQLTATWTTPAGNGGTISGYTATASPGSSTCSTTAPTVTCTLTGLTNGLTYTVSVTATSNVGTGPAGTATGIPYPATLMTSGTLGAWYDAPTASTMLNASGTAATSGQAIATWKDRSAAGIDVSQSTAGNRGTLTTMNGLAALASTSTTYLSSTASGSFRTIFAVADNSRAAAWGTTFASPANTDYSQRLVNGALNNPGNANDWHTTTTLNWTNSVQQGSATGTTGPAIYVSQAPSTQSGTASLGTGFSYAGVQRTLIGSLGEVIVINGTLDGGSITSAHRRTIEEYLARKWSVAITPSAPVTTLATGDASTTLSWTLPWDGGSSVTGYTATAVPSDGTLSTVTQSCSASPCTVTGLTNGATYSVTLTATNAIGTGPASSALSTIPRPAVLVSANSQLWLDSADLTTIFQDTAKTTATTTAGQAIAAWKDKSGQGNDVLAPGAVPGTAPVADTTTFTTGVVPVFSSGRYLTVSTGFPTNADYSVFALYRPTSSACTNNILSGTAASTHAFYLQSSAGLSIWHNATQVGANAGNTVNTAYVGTGLYTETTRAVSVDVNAATAVTGTVSYSNSNAGIQIGAFVSGYGFCGQIAETGVINRLLTSTERRSIQEYLGRKWSVAITPQAPTGVSVTNGDGQTTAAWSAPAWNGGSAVTGYTVTATPTDSSLSTVTASCASSPCTVTGLTNGASYTVTVAATNALGTGPASATSTTTTAIPYPATVMTSARLTLWLDGADSASLYASSGCTGSAASSAVGCWKDKSGQGDNATQATGSAQPALTTVAGRSVPGFNGTGSILGLTSPSTMPTGTTSSTEFVVATLGDSNPTTTGYRVVFDWGANSGSQARTLYKDTNVATARFDARYTANSTPGSWSTSGPSIVVAEAASASLRTALNGVTYTSGTSVSFTTGTTLGYLGQSVNADSRWNGPIPEVIVFTGTLTTAERRVIDEYLARKWAVSIPPQAPTAVTATAPTPTTASVSWTAPAWTGGAAITSYTVTSSPGSFTCTSATTSCTVSGLTPATAYTFTVTATNSVGTGAASAASASVTTPVKALNAWGLGSSGRSGALMTSINATSAIRMPGQETWSSVTAGYQHSCGLTSAGALYCWGANGSGQLGLGDTTNRWEPVVVSSGTAWSSVSAGYLDTCAIRSSDSTLWCWGYNPDGEVGNASTTSPVSSPTQVSTSGVTTWSSVSVGRYFACGLKTDATLWCWGYGANGRLGIGSTTTKTTPQQVAVGTTVSAVSAGWSSACGIKSSDSSMWCWGTGTFGQLGNGGTGDQYSPVAVSAGTTWSSVSSGDQHACGLRTSGALYCWGYNANGQLGNNSTSQSTTPVQENSASTAWTAVTAFHYATCGRRSTGAVYCWGYNGYGELGDGTTTDRSVPTVAGSSTSWSSISGGYTTTCGVRTDTAIWCQGYDGTGETGHWYNNGVGAPTPLLAPSASWTAGSMGTDTGCGIQYNGTLWCWGANGFGQAGLGDTTQRNAPVQVGAVTTWASVSVGANTTCAIRTDNSLWCWGYAGNGQTGVSGASGNITSPTAGPSGTWSSVSVGENHTCGIKTDGTLWCWGNNGSGQLGLGNTTTFTTPQSVTSSGVTTWSSVSAGYTDSCAIAATGSHVSSLYCWGLNTYGQVGDGTTTNATSPLRPDSSTWAQVAVGRQAVCGVRTSGALYCWGQNNYGQNGQGGAAGTPASNGSPQQVGAVTTWAAAGVGDGIACATRTDTTVWCWGRDDYRQLGDRGSTTRTSPQQVSGLAANWLDVHASSQTPLSGS